jgi:hypothetical protein
MAAMEIEPPLRSLPTAKEKKYDRQLRKFIILIPNAVGLPACSISLLINRVQKLQRSRD